MKQRHWREMVEIIGVLSIVAAVLLLALELKQSNHIAKSELAMQLATMNSEVHLARATNVEFAKLFAKIDNPESQLFTATDVSQIRGLTWHYINLYQAVQISFDDEMIDRALFDDYKTELARVIEKHPGLAKPLADALQSYAPAQDLEVFAPVAELNLASDK